jgi:hypothetical protein
MLLNGHHRLGTRMWSLRWQSLFIAMISLARFEAIRLAGAKKTCALRNCARNKLQPSAMNCGAPQSGTSAAPKLLFKPSQQSQRGLKLPLCWGCVYQRGPYSSTSLHDPASLSVAPLNCTVISATTLNSRVSSASRLCLSVLFRWDAIPCFLHPNPTL